MEDFTPFLEWVWARHHNILSWYVRPLFILPFCYFAYRRNLKGLLLTVLLLPTSLFWFPAPTEPSPQVVAYLAYEQEFLTGGDTGLKLVFVTLVMTFFVALATAFWKRSWLYGLIVLNMGTIMKVVWSVMFAGEIGWASLLPSIVTLAICDTALILAARWLAHRPSQSPRSVHH
jgi:hypothetical protein